jgi:protein phosphatase
MSDALTIELPALSLVVLVGPSGCGKSTFAARHFLPTEVLSSDSCRAWVADDATDQSATPAAFEVLELIATKRLAAGRLTVVDATNVQSRARQPLVELARAQHVLPVAIVFDLPEGLCHHRNAARTDRAVPRAAIHRQVQDLKHSLAYLSREGFRQVHVLRSAAEVDAVTLTRQPLWVDRRTDHGPFDIIGDVHGCFDELAALLAELGYRVDATLPDAAPPAGRKAVFLGDLVDRGPDSVRVLRLVMAMAARGDALVLPGNHDEKLSQRLRGREVRLTHGLAETLAQVESEAPAFRAEVAAFLDGLVSHYVLDEGQLVVAHAGLAEPLQGRASRTVRDFALYGSTTGERDEYDLPVRLNWGADYRGAAAVVYGHTPVWTPEWLNRTINIDTGCVFGGRLTALRWPDRTLLSVPAQRAYAASPRPFGPTETGLSAQQAADELLDVADLCGTLRLDTRLIGQVVVREERTAAALEVMGRFAANPKWLITLPPTMSPCETSARPGLLEHPDEAFAYFRAAGVGEVVCEEKHMGSRALVVLCRDEDVARRRFGVVGEGCGLVFTRTGRPFFPDPTDQAALLTRLDTAMRAAGLWSELATDWVCLDAELMPWSAKADGLVRRHFAPVGAAGSQVLAAASEALATTSARDVDVSELLPRVVARADAVAGFVAAYRRYCWPVVGLDGLRLAPFHVLASADAVHIDRDHVWHMDTLARLAATGDPLFVATPYRVVDLSDADAVAAAVAWWEALVAAGGEGMVVKPRSFLATDKRGLVQPALKVRGPEYLRLIYGPEYTLPDQLDRLRERSLGPKRALARQELALGIEALERFVRGEPLRRVHECVFGVLALESEAVDPRL